MVTVAEELFEAHEIVKQVKERDGVDIALTVPNGVYFNRSYTDAFPSKIPEGSPMRILEQRIRLFLGQYIVMFGRKDPNQQIQCKLVVYPPKVPPSQS